MTNPREKMDEEPDNRDPAQLSLPFVDTSNAIIGWFTPPQILPFLPSIMCFLFALLLFLVRAHYLALAVISIALPLGFVALYLVISTRSRWWISPVEKAQTLRTYFSLRREMPWGHEETAHRREHGVRRIFSDGLAEMDDGRLVGLVALDGRNTYGMAEADRNQLVAQLSQGIDEEINDFDFSYYSTTRRPDPEEVIAAYEDRAYDDLANSENPYGRELLHDIADWYCDVDEPAWQSREWNHYIVVAVTPSEAEIDRSTSFLRSFLRSCPVPLPFVGDENRKTREKRIMQRLLDERLATVEHDVLGSLDGVDGERVTADEHACLLLSYWTGEEHTPDEELQVAAKRTITGPSIWPDSRQYRNPHRDISTGHVEDTGNDRARDRLLGRGTPQEATADGGSAVESGETQAFTPGHFDVRRGYTEVGDQYCKTYWLAEWPVTPDSLFFEHLYSMRDVDVDIRIHASAEDKQSVLAEHAHDRAAIGAERHERAEEGDMTIDDVENDADAYTIFQQELRTTNTQSWQINGYVTVRAGTLRALEEVDQVVDDHDTLDSAKMDALRRTSDTVRKALSGAPADTLPVCPSTRQREAFASASPTGRDQYDEATRVKKSTRVLGGVLGALFPPCTGTVEEEGGLDWGRNEHDGRLIRADPFDRGAAPHIITIGQSRSGKTYSSAKAAGRWYHADDDRTLIVCDTQSGFDGLTKLCDGKHIVVDGSETINPLDIQPVPEYVRESAGGQVDPYRMKVDEATQFFAGILRSQGIEPGEYMSTIEEVLEATYGRADIVPHDLNSHANPSPTIEDFLDVLGDMIDEPLQFTHTDNESEGEIKRNRASHLLDLLSGFKPGGKYAHLVGETETGLADPDVDMAYLDLQQFKGQGDAERSAMLHLMLGQVSQKIKRAPGECIFMIDEAHFLLHSEEMSAWLEKAAREWARYSASMWFISQHPAEFVSDEGDDTKKDKITAQCSTVQFFRTPKVETQTLIQFGLNDQQAREVKNGLTTGKSGRGYSECLLQLQDREGWFPIYVEASPFEDAYLNYTPREHGQFESWMREQWGEF